MKEKERKREKRKAGWKDRRKERKKIKRKKKESSRTEKEIRSFFFPCLYFSLFFIFNVFPSLFLV